MSQFRIFGAIAVAGLTFAAASAESATSRDAMVATVHPLATDAGVAVLRQGGNAIDAAVAAALTLGVVDNHNSGLGGGCLILLRLADGQLVAIDGRETAPAAANRDMYVRGGEILPSLSQIGPLAVAVPGALAAYDLAINEHGTRELSELLAPGIRHAAEGFAIDASYARQLKSAAPLLAEFAGSRAALLKPNGAPYVQGEILKQPDLAQSYRQLAEQGTEWFYRGAFAESVADWMVRHGGLLTAADFAAYRAKRRAPLVTEYRDWTIVGFPPPSSGGVHVAQILNILESFDLRSLQERDQEQVLHVIVEAMKLAFADRAYWLGDADFAEVPRGLISQKYADQLAARIDPRQATDVPAHGTPTGWRGDLFGRHTTHIAAADKAGNWVAITATVNTGFGSKVIVPGTGIVLNNEMDDFSIQPGVPNVFGLVGAENNAVAPGKRPLSSMSPTIVLDQQGQPVLTLGAAGGPRIISQVVLTILRHLEFGQPLPVAVAAPRLHHQWLPQHVSVESDLPAEAIEDLRARGHQVRKLSAAGVTQAIARLPDGEFLGVHDPRIPGKAAGPSN